MRGLPSIPGPGPDRELIRPAEWISPERYAAMLDHLITADRAEWPFGHPCRNCDELAINHPVIGPPVDCEEWR